MSIGYFCSPFFLLKARFIVEKCMSPWSLLSIWQYSTWKSSREKWVKNGFDLKPSLRGKTSKNKQSEVCKKSPPTESEAMFNCQNVFKWKPQSICVTFVYHWAPWYSSHVEEVILILWCVISIKVIVLHSKMQHCLQWARWCSQRNIS